MSGFAAVVGPGGLRADGPEARALTAALAPRGPRGDLWCDGRALLLQQGGREPAGPVRPVVDPASGRVVVLDGFLGERPRLDALPGVAGVEASGDADRLHRALEAWRDATPDRLEGAWAWAVWDPGSRTLTAVRGALGVRPLFHAALADGRHAVASDLRTLRALGAGDGPDPEALLERLVPDVTLEERTLFRGIHRVRAGHQLVIDPGGIREERWWHPGPAPDLAAASMEDAAAAVRESVSAALRDRLDGVPVAAVDLSGGLDSSAIAALGAGLGLPVALECGTVSYPGLDCDETAWARSVAHHIDRPHHCAASVAIAPDDLEHWVAVHADPLCPAAGWSISGLHREGRERGVVLRLDGEGGDEWFGWSWAHVADLLGEGALAEAWEAVGDAGGAAGRTRRLVEHGVRRMVPLSLRRRLRGLRTASRLPPWIAPAAPGRGGLEERLRLRDAERVWVDRDADELWFEAGGGFASLGMEHMDAWGTEFGLLLGHPFLDRRVVTTALSLPGRLRRGDGEGKAVLRAALRGRLPDAVVDRREKSSFGHLSEAALHRFGGRPAFDTLDLVREGFVDGEVLRRMAAEAFPTDGSGAVERHRVILWLVVTTEAWWRTYGRVGG